MGPHTCIVDNTYSPDMDPSYLTNSENLAYIINKSLQNLQVKFQVQYNSKIQSKFIS